MTLGGRPPEEGGHKGVRLSLNEKAREILEEARKRGQNKSTLVEAAIFAFVDPRLNRLYGIMHQQPLIHTYLNDQRISFKIGPSGQVDYRLRVIDALRIMEDKAKPSLSVCRSIADETTGVS